MSDHTNPEEAIEYILKTAPRFAKAKAARIYLTEFRKSKKALMLRAHPSTSTRQMPSSRCTTATTTR